MKEDKKLKGMSPEMAAEKMSKKSGVVMRTEALLSRINMNQVG